uniref:30S ribosomal protein S1 n=1 Tax=Anthurium amnicola TaxID=1678845 RepID=A0A1D1Y231_9ARAE
MDGFTACSSAGGGHFIHLLPAASSCKKQRDRSSRCRRSIVFRRCLASRDGGGQPELDRWDQMELKFGRLLGEDPKLTLAKIMGRKANPDVSYLEIEKSFREKQGQIDYGEVVDSDSLGEKLEVGGKKLRPPTSLQVPKRTGNAAGDSNLNLVRPIMDKKMKPVSTGEKPVPASTTQSSKATERIGVKDATPNVALRKPIPLQGDEFETEKKSKFRIKPNLVLKMRKDPVDSLNDVPLLKKPEVMKISSSPPSQESVPSSNSVGSSLKEMTASNDAALFSPITRPATPVLTENNEMESPRESPRCSDGMAIEGVTIAEDFNSGMPSDLVESESSEGDGGDEIGLQLSKPRGVGPDIEEGPLLLASASSRHIALQRKPNGWDGPAEEMSHTTEADKVNLDNGDHGIGSVGEHFASVEQEEHEVDDWRRAEDLHLTGERTEVELISCSSSGFFVSFGSLIGFLPFRNLGTKWKFLAFESWLRKKGLDPFLYKQKLRIMGSYVVQKKNVTDSSENLRDRYEDTGQLAPDMKFEDLLDMYDQEKNKFLSSFVGQTIRVSVVLADQESRRLVFSGKLKEKEELVERKRSLMARLSVGDVVKCWIKKITYFGIFVEVKGVPALIHQSEISWDVTLDPSSFFKIGQIVDAKVHQLDYTLERITLSLKEMTPDPLNEALESVVGDLSLDGRLVITQEDTEWVDVESLIKELREVEGVLGVSKGLFFLSPGLAPTFQVYMASMYENQYKLLARYGNKVQEVLVQSSMDKEQMKAAILTCTNRVE